MRATSVAAASLIALGACANPNDPDTTDPTFDQQASGSYREYQVTFTNLTTGQPMSPPAFVVHAPGRSIFAVGTAASEEIRQIAENGDPGPLIQAVTGTDGIGDAFAGNGPVHRIGGPGSNSMTVTVRAQGRVSRLSIATMLICTNDGITGLNSIQLPTSFSPVTYRTAGYDAGTESNTEADGDIVPPCFGIGPVAGNGGPGRTPESALIRHHPGITGGSALTAAHRWRERVAVVRIVRTR